jgi:EAL domain-containing protein (putative c-di-GMP-specific phosphodiesterase class I)
VANRRLAVIIGVNGAGVGSSMSPLRYAERDARAISDLLTDPVIGTFHPSDVALFVGPDVRADEIKGTLRRIALQSDESDVLLVYFAGHTLEPSWSHGTDLYLVTPDLDEADLSGRPDAGLRMAFLTRDVLPYFQGTSMVILDCCRAGSFATFQGADLIGFGGRSDPRHGMLAACAAGEYAREDPAVRHGVLTRHVLDGLRGAATDPRGVVTFEMLSAYVCDRGLDPRPSVSLRARETIQLTRPGVNAARPEHPSPPLPAQFAITALANPLDRHTPELMRLIRRLVRNNPGPASAGHVERVRSALGAGAVAYLGSGEEGYVAIDATRGFDLDALRGLLRVVGPPGFGHVASDGLRRLWCAPLGRPAGDLHLLAVVDPPEWLVDLGQVGAKVLETIWHTDFTASPEESELQLLTALRSVFGRVPAELFDRALLLYRKVLESIRIVFQPVVTIGEAWTQVGVYSYEALARRSLKDQYAPGALLKLAHTWGDHFVVERDRCILGKALTAYKLAHADSPWSSDVPKPVSVNVSVRSLLDDSYVETLRQLISELQLAANAVTLEISEQDPIEPWATERWGEAPHEYFNNRLATISRDVGVAFALDDFGVGHASLARMVDLRLTHIKVDRAILQHELATQELDLVVAVARAAVERGETHTPRAVVVEGVDDESPVSLRQIYRSGIRHVQGYVTGERGAADLHHLTLEVRKDIATRVRGDDENRPTAITRADPPASPAPLRRSA